MSKMIEKKTDNVVILQVFAKPNSKRQEIVVDGDNLIIQLCSKPVQNKANKELLSLLKKKLKIPSNQIELISGANNSKKVLKLSFSRIMTEDEVLKALLS